jgi:Uma2 family endonuclease
MEIDDPNEVPMAPPLLRRHEVEYPESDGKPMAETDFHVKLMLYLLDALHRRFREDRDVYIAGNNFVYFEEGNPSAVVSPDVYVVRGVPSHQRRIYKVWKEGKAPDLVIELTSRSTHIEDLGNKRAIYEALGVKEYFIFDPEGDLDPPFRGFRRKGGTLMPVAPRRALDGMAVFRSDVLGLELHGRGAVLRWVEPVAGRALPTSLELAQEVEEQTKRTSQAERRAAQATRQAEQAKRRADTAKRRADKEKRRAETEKRRADAAEAELALLRRSRR